MQNNSTSKKNTGCQIAKRQSVEQLAQNLKQSPVRRGISDKQNRKLAILLSDTNQKSLIVVSLRLRGRGELECTVGCTDYARHT
jgi:hypothetical protein